MTIIYIIGFLYFTYKAIVEQIMIAWIRKTDHGTQIIRVKYLKRRNKTIVVTLTNIYKRYAMYSIGIYNGKYDPREPNN